MTLVLLFSTFITSFISGVIGMGGGMILMGLFSALLPISKAMIFHGVTQLGSNGFRALLLWRHIQFKILKPYIFGTALGFMLFSLLVINTSKELVFILLGGVPLLIFIIPKSINLDISKNHNAILCGFVITGIQLLAGASGPILDIFYLNSGLNRFQIMATKAITQTIGHLSKILYFVIILKIHDSFEPILIILFPLTMIGAFLGKKVLKRMDDAQFLLYSKYLIGIIGLVYIYRGLTL